jgi:hypothetical protein
MELLGDPSEWALRQIDMGRRYAAAVAVETRSRSAPSSGAGHYSASAVRLAWRCFEWR